MAGGGELAVVASDEDAAAIEAALASGSFPWRRLPAGQLSGALDGRAPLALITTFEMLTELNRGPIADALAAQPAWSDLPILLVVRREEAKDCDFMLKGLADVRLIERPINPGILHFSVRAATGSRERRTGASRGPDAAEEARAGYDAAREALEQRVKDRSSQLETAYDRLVREAEERWSAEKRLRESEELYRYTVELSRQLVWTADAEGTIRTINPRFGQITGLPSETPAHQGWLQSVHPDDLPGLLEYWRSAIAEGRRVARDFRMRQADGSYRMFRTRAAPRHDEAGRIIRWYGTTEDIEEQTRADAARLAADERYRLAAYASNDAIWDLDVASGRIEWTASSTGFFGHGESVETGLLSWWEDQVHPDDRERVIASLAGAIDGEGSHWAEVYRFRRASGAYADVYDQGYILRDDQGRARRAVGAMADVTDRQRAEAELRKMQSELIHVSRLSAMGAMASTLAHEINQPLTAISSYVSGSRRLLKGLEGPKAAQVADALEAAEAAAQRAGQIVRRLRELVARGNVSVRAEELPKLIADACAVALVDAPLLGVSHQVRVGRGAQWVYADRIQIQQVLINLLRNALQAMAQRPRRLVTIRAVGIPGGKVEISVADTGAGLAEDLEEALFSPFRSTKPDGMGIGLSISRTIIEAHGGKIWAERRKRGGAIFRFTLPAADEAALAHDELAASAEAQALRIL